MTRKPNEQGRETLPPGIPYGWPLGMVAVAALCWLGMWAYQHMNYTCVAFRAMCEERERLERIPETTTASVAPAQRWGPSHALQMPEKPRPEWVTVAEGCPPDYQPFNGACWVEVKERVPCERTYFRNGKCWAPLHRAERPGVSDGAFR